MIRISCITLLWHSLGLPYYYLVRKTYFFARRYSYFVTGSLVCVQTLWVPVVPLSGVNGTTAVYDPLGCDGVTVGVPG